MTTTAPFDFGPSGAARFSRNAGRSVTGEALGTMRYPSPFFDIAQLYLPTSFKTLLRWCRYYYLTNPLVNAVCQKMAEYPVTDWIMDTENQTLKKKWEDLFGSVLNFKQFEIESGLDFNVYGNCFVSIYFPFRKMLKCKACGHQVPVDKKKYSFRDFRFHGECERCMNHGEFNVRDHYLKSYRDVRLIRWNPENITIQHNEVTGESRYYYQIPAMLSNDIRMGKRHIIERTPQVFIEALRKNKALLFNKDNIYHMKRPTIAQKDKGWGIPMVLPVLKDVFYLQIMRKAQECVSLDSFIETEQGLVRADDIKVGDFVRTHTGKFQSVEAKWYRSARDEEVGVRITPTGLRAFPSTYSPKHPVFTIRRTEENRRSDTKDHQRSSVILRNPHLYEEVVCPASQMGVGDYVLYPRHLPEEPQTIDVAKYTGFASTENFVYSGCSISTAKAFECLERGESVKHDNADRVAKRALKEGRTPKRMPSSIDLTEDLAYILGWYAGDGSCGSRHVVFTIGQTDPRYYDENIKTAIKKVFGIECTGTENDSTRDLTACCVILEKLIKGIIPGTARKKKVPAEILNSPKLVKLAFLRGLFESDGWVGSKRGTLCISSKNLSYDTYRMLISLGCTATVSKKKTKASTLKNGQVIKGGPSYPLDISTASKDRLLSLWECGDGPEVVSGKSGFFWKEWFATRVCAVEEVEESSYIDFKIAEDTTFCLPGTATKNSIMVEHIVPMRVLFPQSASGTADVYSTINLSQWRDKIEQEVLRWRIDNNYIPILPIPIGQQTLGGDGRALLLSQEYRVWTEHIISGMGVPVEFVYGQLNFSGANVSMRILENKFIDSRTQTKQMLSNFIIPKIAAFMGWQIIEVHAKKFKMADDLQRSAFYLQLNQAGKLSDKSLLEDTDWDSRKEREQIATEHKQVLEQQRVQALAQAAIQGESQLTMAKYQMRGQKLMMQQTPEMAGQGMPAGEPMPTAGVPGQASPNAVGQMITNQTGMMSQSGQVPGMEIPPDSAQSESPLPGAESPLTAGQGVGYDIIMVAQKAVSWLNKLPDHEKYNQLAQIRNRNPQLFSLVLQLLNESTGAEQNSAGMPMPEQRAPQRGPEAVTV